MPGTTLQSLLIAACVVFVLALSPASAGQPSDAVSTVVDEVVRILEDPSLAGPSNAEARKGRVLDAVKGLIDFEDVSRRTLAMHWRERTPAERTEFVRIYRKFLLNFYLGKIESQSGYKVEYLEEVVRGGKAEVRTRVLTKTAAEVNIAYRLKKARDGSWKVYDMVIEGVSLVASYRSQFDDMIQGSSYEEFFKKLKSKISGE